MARANHRCDPFFPQFPIRAGGSERPDPALLRKAQRRFVRSSISCFKRFHGNRFINPSGVEGPSDASLPIAARSERAGEARCVGLVVDVTELTQSAGDRIDGRLPLPLKAAFIDLPEKVGSKLGPARCKAGNVT